VSAYKPTRREFVSGVIAAGGSAGFGRTIGLKHHAQTRSLERPTPAQLAWQDLELGMFVHFGPNTWQDREYDDRSIPPSEIIPTVDTDQWVDAAVAMGARYLVMVAKHVGGFCMWPTETTDYSIRSTPWKDGSGDVMADLARSCAARDIGLGVYLSPRDDSFAAGQSGRCGTPEEQARYDAVYRQQLTELLTLYGPIMELWLDGSSVVPTADLVGRYAPDAMVFQGPNATIRWVGNEDGFAPYPCWNSLAAGDAATGHATALHGDPDGDRWLPVEVDVSLRRPNWFWSTTNQENLLSLDELIEIYYRSVGRGAQLLLNVTPDRSGRIPEWDARRLREFGNAIRLRFEQPTAETAGTRRVFTLDFGGPRRIDHVMIQEDLATGERVRGYRIEAGLHGRWGSVGEGSGIGHKRIHPIGSITATELRLTVTQAVGTPEIPRFAAFDIGAPPPPRWNAPVRLWADNVVADWSPGELEIDLTEHVDAVGQYRLRFVTQSAQQTRTGEIELLVDDIPQPGLVRAANGRDDVLLMTVRDLGQSIVLRATVEGGGGQVLVRRG
jgi:alpha-L-fucosidase